MHHDLVEKKAWVSERRFLHALNYCMLLPGPEAQQLATYVGWLLHGVKGGLVAGLLFILPGMLMLLGLSYVYVIYGHQQAVINVLGMLKPAVIAIVAFAAYRMGARVLQNRLLWLFAFGACFAIMLFRLPFPYILASAALLGLAGSYIKPVYFLPKKELTEMRGVEVDSLAIKRSISLHSRLLGTLRTCLIALLCWLLPLLLLFWLYGGCGLYTQMAMFFTKMAWLTFGGAYAVLPYVNQAAVEHYGWLTSAQMMDGLALGETTPGPLILVFTYVGFLGGWAHGVTSNPLVSGLIAAIVATYFTFLPSFLLIFAGAPWIEHSLNSKQLNGVLTAISASIIGVIAALAVSFAQHVFWALGRFDVVAAGLTIIAFIMLVWARLSVLKLVMLFVALGLVQYLFLLIRSIA